MGEPKIPLPVFGEKIIFSNNTLLVPNVPQIPFMQGDGVGAGLWSESVRAIDKAVEKAYSSRRKIAWFELPAGERAHEFYGTDNYVPDETLEYINDYKIAIKGPMTSSLGSGSAVNTRLREALGLSVCVREIKYVDPIDSPLKHPRGINTVVFRDAIEDVYAGIEFEPQSEGAKNLLRVIEESGLAAKLHSPKTTAFGVKPVSREKSEQLMKATIEYAIKTKRASITIVHKGDRQKSTEGLFCKWCYDAAKRFFPAEVVASEECGGNAPVGKILLQDILADSFMQQALLRPQDFDTLVALNLTADYISDLLTAAVGGVGLIPGAHWNYTTGVALFEVTHSAIPKFAGLDKVNPTSFLLAASLLLSHLGWSEAAQLLRGAVEKTYAQKNVTYDMVRSIAGAREVKCSEFVSGVIDNIETLV